MAGSFKPGPLRPDPFSKLLPATTPGPLGRNDAADPNVKAQLGDTPGPLGIRDHAEPFPNSKLRLFSRGQPFPHAEPGSMQEKEAWDQLTEEEQKIIAAMDNGKTTRVAFNKKFEGKGAQEIAALVVNVKNLIDNAGGHSNSEVWQKIQSIDGGWVGDKKGYETTASLSLTVKQGFLDTLKKSGKYDVDRYYEVPSNHKHSARFITDTSFQPGMHFVQQEEYPDNKYDVHWDPRSSAFKNGHWMYKALGLVLAKDTERAAAGLTHENPFPSTKVREELKKMGIASKDKP